MRRWVSGVMLLRLALAIPAAFSIWYGLALRSSLGYFVNGAENHAATHLSNDPSKLGFVAWLMSGVSGLFGDCFLVAGAAFLILAALPWGTIGGRHAR